jgi:hypothetical protein
MLALMEAPKLIGKIQRLRAAVGAAEDRDLSKFKAKWEPVGDGFALRQDMTGGMTEPEMQNVAAQIISSIADLKDHLRMWPTANGHDPDEVDATVKGCKELALVIDLNNFDKHGSHGRGTWSGEEPELRDVRRMMIVKSVPGNKTIGFRPVAGGGMEPFGGDGGKVTIDGDVVLKDGSKKPLWFIQVAAIEAWEQIFEKFEIPT